MNLLSGSHNNSQTTFTFSKPLGSMIDGCYIAVDLEIIYVWTVVSTTGTATVQRGMLGSTAATHSDAALVTVNPRFPKFSILQAINADLDDLSASPNGLYQVKNVTLTYNPAAQGYDLTSIADYVDVLRVRAKIPGPSKAWPEIRSFQLKRNMDTTDFASGNAIILYEGGYPGLDIRVTYSQAFTHLSALTDDVVTVSGLPATMHDIPPLGAAARLSGVRETKRNFTEGQGDGRRATEVPPGSQTNSMRGLLAIRQARIRAESARLGGNYPARRHTGVG